MRKRKDAETQPLTLIGHLEELRARLWICVASIFILSVWGFSLAPRLVERLKRPAGDLLPRLAFFNPLEAMLAHVKVALAFGLFVSMPVLLYELWGFIRPGLTARERRIGGAFVGWGTLMFLGGVAFGYWVCLPPTLRFLLAFGAQTLEPVISVSHYLSFVLTLLLACGVVFELPVVLFFLTKLGVVTPQALRHHWKLAFLAIVAGSAILTPTKDIVTLLFLTLPLLLLYGFSILVSTFAKRS